MTTFFWQYWAFNIPNYAMAAVLYTLLGRFVMGLFVGEDWDNYIWRAFRRLTDPFVGAARLLTPRAVADVWMAPVAAVWLMVARVAFALVMIDLGLAPPVGPASG